MVVHNIIKKNEGKNASANMIQKTGNIKNYKKTENSRGKNNQTQTRRHGKKSSLTASTRMPSITPSKNTKNG